MRTIVIGLDLGLSGAVAVHQTSFAKPKIETFKMPIKGDKKPSIDIAALRDLLLPYQGQDALIIYERLGQIFKSTKATAFSMGYQRGLVEALCVAMGFAYVDIPPKEWQKEMFIGTPGMLDSKGKQDTKGMAAVAARRLYPDLDLTFPGMKKNFHDGLCDSVLIGAYALRKNL